MIHEWMHRLLNGPDEFCFDHEKRNPLPYEQFHTITGNSFVIPELSPFLSYYLNANWQLPNRRSYTFQGATDFTQRPNKVTLRFDRSDTNYPISAVEITQIRVSDSYGNPENYFPNKPDQVVPPIFREAESIPKPESGIILSESTILMNQDLFDDRPDDGANLWLIKARLEGGDEEWLFLPASVFMMTKFQADFDGEECEEATYDVEFLNPDEDRSGHKRMEMETIHEDEIDDFLGKDHGDRSLHAKLKITGTEFYTVWLTRP